QRYLLLALALIPLSLLASNLQQIFLGLERFRALNLFSIAYAILSLILLGILLWQFNTGVAGAIGARAIAVLVLAIGLFFWARRILGGVSWHLNRHYLKAAAKFGLQAHLANVVQFLNYRLDLFLVNVFVSPVAVGFYAVATEVVERLWLLSGAASTVLYPRIAAESDESARASITAIVSRNVLWLSVAGGAIVYGLSHWVVTLLYSTEYLPTVRPLQILLPGIVAFAASRVLAHDIAGRGRPILNSYASIIGLAINLGLNLALIPRYGIEGAAWATTASYSAMWGLTLALYCGLSKNTPWSVTLLRRADVEMWGRLAATAMRWARKRTGLTHMGWCLSCR
ncbi:MAG: polysaccharide biosynthesis C-terminal domain-containing protein, partial [Chloroflexi bacterium]|nr:polysaccharide biosynthesis C-terminal domain-containing protein [Chloroflexota bacterium]